MDFSRVTRPVDLDYDCRAADDGFPLGMEMMQLMNTRRVLSWRLGLWITAGVGALIASLGQGCPSPIPTEPAGLEPETVRVAFKSQCALNVIECTSSWPTAVASVVSGCCQTVTETDTGFVVQGSDGDGAEWVRLVASDSVMGNGATRISYSWSSRADDDDPRTLDPGEEFSTAADPEVLLQEGFH